MNIEQLRKLYKEIKNEDEDLQIKFEEAMEIVRKTAQLANENAFIWDEALEEYYGDVNWGTPEYKQLKKKLEEYNLDDDPAKPYYWLPSDYACM